MDGITLTWDNLSYCVPDPKTKKDKLVLDSLTGCVQPGQMLAVMGPSGAGKSTFLDALAGKINGIQGQVLLNGKSLPIKPYNTYIHQDDALIGCLTVRETITYAAKFKLPSSTSSSELKKRVDEVIAEFGLQRVEHSTIGNAILRGVSGGEKRRVTLACQLITYPPIIFLDEPTSGLDSAAAYNVMKTLKDICQSRNLCVISTIHQPSSETYALFDNLLLLGQGSTLYCGPREQAETYFANLGYPLPKARNPADYYLDLVNVDFLRDLEEASRRIQEFKHAWSKGVERAKIDNEVKLANSIDSALKNVDKSMRNTKNGFVHQTGVLMHRNLVVAYKNVVAYWIRVAMYVALAILMGTTWIHIAQATNAVQDRFSLHFFSVAFLCFMSVAGIPAFLEDRLTFIRERGDGMYTVGPYVLANTLVSIPFIFLIAIAFSSTCYFLIGLKAGAVPFFTFVMYLFLALLVAESICVFVSAMIPIFVAALAIVAFLNGFFMVVQGYFVERRNIPRGWIWAHWIDYQKYAFEGIIQSDFSGLKFDCETFQTANGTSCVCPIKSSRAPDNACYVYGEDILDNKGYVDIHPLWWALALIGMVLVYRFGFYLALLLKSNKR